MGAENRVESWPVGNYTEEFRRQAVDLYRSSPGATLRGIAADLGISRRALQVWVHGLVPELDPGRQALVRALVPARCQARFRGFVLAIAARCRRFMRCTPGPIGLFWLLDQWFSHMPRTPVYRLGVVSGDGAIFVFLHGVSAIVARFLRNLRRISDGRRDAARSYRPDGSRAAYHLRHPHYRHPVLR